MIFGVFGRHVATLRFGADGTAGIDTRALAAGLYVVRVTLPGGGSKAVRFTVVC